MNHTWLFPSLPKTVPGIMHVSYSSGKLSLLQMFMVKLVPIVFVCYRQPTTKSTALRLVVFRIH